MLRYVFAGACVCLFSLNLVLADTFKGKVQNVDEEKQTVTVNIDGQDKTLPVAKDAKIYSLGKAKKGLPVPEVASNLGGASGKDVTLTTDKKDGKDVVTAIKIESAAKKKKIKS